MIHVDNIPKYAYDGMGDYFKDLPEDKYAYFGMSVSYTHLTLPTKA